MMWKYSKQTSVYKSGNVCHGTLILVAPGLPVPWNHHWKDLEEREHSEQTAVKGESEYCLVFVLG